jgi:alginate O-acetyltransferase complex protein AlgF
MKQFLIAGVAALTFVESAQANDQQLYDAAPPADSAFIRVINGTADAVDVTVGAAAYAKVAKGSAASYQIVKEGEYNPALVVSGKSTQEAALKVVAGKYYTLAVVKDAADADGVAVKEMEDAQMSNPAKAYVYFYNLSDKANAAVRAPKFNKDVTAVTSTPASASKDLGQATVDLAVTAEGKDVKLFSAVALQRRAGVTFVLSGAGDALEATMVANEVKR